MRPKAIKFGVAVLLTAGLTACGNTTAHDQQHNQPAPSQSPSAGQGTKQEAPSQAGVYYTANEGGSISKVDAATNKVLSTIKLEGAVHNIQVSPDGKVVGATLVPSMGGHNHSSSMKMNGYAYFYDTATDKLINQIAVGGHPAHIVFTNDGKYALVTNNEDNTVTVIDTKSYTAAKSISTGKGPHGFRISNDSKFAYVANMSEDTVSVIDLSSMKETKKIKVGKAPVTTGIKNDGKTLVVTLNAENALAVVDLATEKVEKIPVGTGPAQVYLQSDDKFAFVANQGTKEKPSNTVSKIDMATKKVVATIETGKGAHGVVTSDDKKWVYVTNMFDNTVSVIDNNQNKVTATVNVEKIPNGISFKK